MTAATTKARPDAISDAEQEARELEGLVDIDPREDLDLLQETSEYHAIKAQIKALEKQAEEKKKRLLKALADRGAQGLVVDGFVFARRSEVQTTSVDTAKLKALAPRAYEKCLRTTTSVRFTAPKRTAES